MQVAMALIIGLFVGGFVVWLRFRNRWLQIQDRLRHVDELMEEVRTLREENAGLKSTM